MRPSTRIRQKLDDGHTIVIPGVDDPFASRMAWKLGFDGVYLGSYSGSARTIGVVDAGFISQTEQSQRIQYLSAANPEQVIFADGESGFGNPLNIARTVNLFEAAGAAAMQLNDTVQVESRCPYIGLPDNTPLPIAEMQARIRTALEARRDPDFMIYCSVRAPSLEERIERSYAVLEAGADSVFFGWKDYSELERYASAMSKTSKPLKVSTYPFASHHPSVKDLSDMGYRIIFFVLHTLYAAAGAEWRVLSELKETGNVTHSLGEAMQHDQLLELLGIDDIRTRGLQHEALVSTLMDSTASRETPR